MRKVPVSYLVLMRDWLLDNVSIPTFLRMIGMGAAISTRRLSCCTRVPTDGTLQCRNQLDHRAVAVFGLFLPRCHDSSR